MSPSLARLALFVAFVVHMQAGPLLGQVLKRRPPPFGMTWTMYSERGIHNCEVQWLAATPQGLEPIDRMAVLGVTEPWKMSSRFRIQRSARDVEAAAQALCDKLPGTDVRARARCGIKHGLEWKEVYDGQTPLCALSKRGKAR